MFSTIAIVENIQREDLNIVEEARGYKRLNEEFSYDQDKIATMMSRSRSHISNTLRLLNLPKDYILGIVPGSDTGALEIALWNTLGPRGVDILAWDSFGSDWVNDIVHQLSLSNTRVLKAEYGFIPNLKNVNFCY